MSEQNETPATGLPRPITNDSQAWKAYWKQAGQPWRTQQEIPSERQHNLEKRLRIAPHIQSGTYPFKGIKLNRADIEWLLSIHEGGKGYVDWNDPDQRERAGLDLPTNCATSC